MKNKYKYLLFDADNTLLDFNASEKNALMTTLNEYSLEFNEEVYNSYHVINDNLWKALERGEVKREYVKIQRFRSLFEKYGYVCDDFEKLAHTFMSNIAKFGIPMKGAIETLEALHGKYMIYIVTNGTVSVQLSRLKDSGIDKYLGGLYMSEAIGFEKPRVEFFDYVINDIGDPDLNKYLVIGDSLTSDIKGAKNKGIDSCFLDHSRKGSGDLSPEFIINNIEEVLCLLI